MEEMEQLKAHAAALEQLLEVYEQEAIEQSNRLHKALETVQDHAQQLAHSEEALQVLKSILDSMGEGVVVTNELGELLFINPAANQALSHSHAQLKKGGADWNHFQGLFLPDRITPYPIEDLPLRRAMRGEAVDAVEMYVCPPSTEGIWLRVSARPIWSEAGKLRGGVAVFHNITTIKKTEDALRQSEAQSRQQAEQLEQTLRELQHTQAQLVHTEKMSSLGQLVAGIAHEINNPVNFIHGNIAPAEVFIADLMHLLNLYQQHYPLPVAEIQAEIEAIDLPFLQEDLPKLLSSLKIGTNRIREIVRSLRNFSRHDESGMKPVDIHEGIDSTLLLLRDRLRPRAGYPGILVQQDYGHLPPVECYVGQINQVFMNILSNAIDALESEIEDWDQGGTAIASKVFDVPTLPRPKPTICIQTEATESQVLIRISDNGCGMAESVKASLFNPFFTTKPIGKGTGLGLYISYQIIVDRHGGVLSCSSKPGQGTEFQIEIPACQVDMSAILAESAVTPVPAQIGAG